MKLPVHRLAITQEFLILAFGSHIQIFNIKTGSLLASTLERHKDERHDELIRLITTAPNSNLLISTGEDKQLCVWQLPDLTLLSKRELNKRATALTLEPDETHVVVADKFGDVFRYELEVREDLSVAKIEPVLGHVSLLTTALITRNGKRIITGDRDEHIRISEFPSSYNIETFLGGHSRFISTLLLCDQDRILLSAGGDTNIFVWNLDTFKLENKLDISALNSTVENFTQVEKITRSGFKKRKKFKTLQNPTLSKENGKDEIESEKVEVVQENGEAEEPEVGKEPEGEAKEPINPLAIQKILEISEPRHCLLVVCSGYVYENLLVKMAKSNVDSKMYRGTGILTLPIENWNDKPNKETLLKLQFPILDLIQLNENHILVTSDCRKVSTQTDSAEITPVKTFQMFEIVEGDECVGEISKIRLFEIGRSMSVQIKPSSSFNTLLDSLQISASAEESSTLSLPDDTSLYPELALLNKDGYDAHVAEGGKEKHEHSKRAGQVGAEPAPKRSKKNKGK